MCVYERMAMVIGTRARGQPHLRFKDIHKRDIKSIDWDVLRGEEAVNDCPRWRLSSMQGEEITEEKLQLALKEKPI